MKNLQFYLLIALLGFGCGRVDEKNGCICGGDQNKSDINYSDLGDDEECKHDPSTSILGIKNLIDKENQKFSGKPTPTWLRYQRDTGYKKWIDNLYNSYSKLCNFTDLYKSYYDEIIFPSHKHNDDDDKKNMVEALRVYLFEDSILTLRMTYGRFQESFDGYLNSKQMVLQGIWDNNEYIYHRGLVVNKNDINKSKTNCREGNGDIVIVLNDGLKNIATYSINSDAFSTKWFPNFAPFDRAPCENLPYSIHHFTNDVRFTEAQIFKEYIKIEDIERIYIPLKYNNRKINFNISKDKIVYYDENVNPDEEALKYKAEELRKKQSQQWMI